MKHMCGDDHAVVEALARAFRWRRILDKGVHGTLEESALTLL